MKRRIFILSMLLAIIGSIANIEVQATPVDNATSEVKTHVYTSLNPFERVNISISAQVLVEQSDCYSVEVTMPLTAPDEILISSEEGRLKISSRHSHMRFNRKAIFIKIKAPIVYEYKVNGSAQLVVNHEVNTGERAFAVEINGSGSVSVAQVVAPDFKAEVNGSGKLNFASVAARESARLVVNGSGKANVMNIASKDTHLELNGSGKVKVEHLATLELISILSGSGNMQVKGVAKNANFKVTGSGTIDATGVKTHKYRKKTMGSGHILLF